MSELAAILGDNINCISISGLHGHIGSSIEVLTTLPVLLCCVCFGGWFLCKGLIRTS